MKIIDILTKIRSTHRVKTLQIISNTQKWVLHGTKEELTFHLYHDICDNDSIFHIFVEIQWINIGQLTD